MTRGALLGGILLAAFAGAATAQERKDPARLDDFALPASDQPERLEQLSPHDRSTSPAQPIDRTIAHPVVSEKSGAMPAQLSSAGDGEVVTQLGSTRDSRPTPGLAISSPTDSKPGAVNRIGGTDRCDPQLAQRVYAECLRILELRAGEFDAPQAPTLSAEQRLLAEQRQREEALADNSTTLRLRYATAMQPNADLESNQELASIYLKEPAPPSQPLPAEEEQPGNLGEILQNLGLGTTVPPTGD